MLPAKKDLKLIWERDPKTERIIRVSNRSATLERRTHFRFLLADRLRTFYVLNIPNKNIREFQQRVSALPATPGEPAAESQFHASSCELTCSEGGRGSGKGQFDSPTGIAVDRNGNFWSPTQVTVASKNSRQPAPFSAVWESKEAATGN